MKQAITETQAVEAIDFTRPIEVFSTARAHSADARCINDQWLVQFRDGWLWQRVFAEADGTTFWGAKSKAKNRPTAWRVRNVPAPTPDPHEPKADENAMASTIVNALIDAGRMHISEAFPARDLIAQIVAAPVPVGSEEKADPLHDLKVSMVSRQQTLHAKQKTAVRNGDFCFATTLQTRITMFDEMIGCISEAARLASSGTGQKAGE